MQGLKTKNKLEVIFPSSIFQSKHVDHMALLTSIEGGKNKNCVEWHTHTACFNSLKESTFYLYFYKAKKKNSIVSPTMASLPYLPVPKLAISYLSLLVLLCALPTAIPQDPTSSSPAIAQCTTSLLPLASCASFVQGTTLTPSMACCDNLKQLYTSVPSCLCLLLNSTNLGSFPINTTRALQVPDLCSLHVNISTCSAPLVPPAPPSSQVSPAVNTNSTINNATVWASPVAQPTPKSGFVGLGLGSVSASFKPRAGIELTVAIAMKTFLLLVVFY